MNFLRFAIVAIIATSVSGCLGSGTFTLGISDDKGRSATVGYTYVALPKEKGLKK